MYVIQFPSPVIAFALNLRKTSDQSFVFIFSLVAFFFDCGINHVQNNANTDSLFLQWIYVRQCETIPGVKMFVVGDACVSVQ